MADDEGDALGVVMGGHGGKSSWWHVRKVSERDRGLSVVGRAKNEKVLGQVLELRVQKGLEVLAPRKSHCCGISNKSTIISLLDIFRHWLHAQATITLQKTR